MELTTADKIVLFIQGQFGLTEVYKTKLANNGQYKIQWIGNSHIFTDYTDPKNPSELVIRMRFDKDDLVMGELRNKKEIIYKLMNDLDWTADNSVNEIVDIIYNKLDGQVGEFYNTETNACIELEDTRFGELELTYIEFDHKLDSVNKVIKITVQEDTREILEVKTMIFPTSAHALENLKKQTWVD